MPLHVYTAQIRYVKAKMPDALDVTRVGNWILQKARRPSPGAIFAPSWDLFNACKTGAVSTEEQYDKRFVEEMRASYRAHGAQWRSILALTRVVLCCYEPFPEHCHRHILRETIFPKLGAVDCGEIAK